MGGGTAILKFILSMMSFNGQFNLSVILGNGWRLSLHASFHRLVTLASVNHHEGAGPQFSTSLNDEFHWSI